MNMLQNNEEVLWRMNEDPMQWNEGAPRVKFMVPMVSGSYKPGTATELF